MAGAAWGREQGSGGLLRSPPAGFSNDGAQRPSGEPSGEPQHRHPMLPAACVCSMSISSGRADICHSPPGTPWVRK